MCSVQVLLLPDTVLKGRDPAPRNVCRRLFSDEGSESRSLFLSAVQRDLELRDRERWNFDFRAGEPLEGRYQWVPTDSTTCPRRKATTQSKITDFLLQRKRQRTSRDECPAQRLKARRLEEQSATEAATVH